MEPIDILYIGPNIPTKNWEVYSFDIFCIDAIKDNQYLIRGWDDGEDGWVSKEFYEANFVLYDDYYWIQGYDVLVLDNHEYHLRMRCVSYLIQTQNLQPQTLSIKDIDWKTKHLNLKSGKDCPCCGGSRYEKVDTSKPIIVATNYPNTDGSLYASLDGKHRIHRMLDEGHTEIQSYVLDYNELKPHYIYGGECFH